MVAGIFLALIVLNVTAAQAEPSHGTLPHFAIQTLE